MVDLLSRIQGALGDRYHIERELGRGGMAVVYLAQDRKHHRRVAIKILKPELSQSLGTERFLREIEIAAQLTHPHILPLHDSGEAGGLIYYVMPYVEGESLRDRLNREKQLPLEDALHVACEVADALSFAHAVGLVHRDIKPENVLFQAGHALVSDFGIARAISQAGGEHLTETGMAVGTLAYMSPEQAAGAKDLDGRSDIYGLGCVLYEMLAGQPPYLTPHLRLRPPEAGVSLAAARATVPATVDRIVAKALAIAPADRFATAARFREALERALTRENASGDADFSGNVTRIRAVPRRRRVVAAALLATLLAVVAVVAVPERVGLRERLPHRTAAPSDLIKLAVLPFENLTGDPQQEYFSDGLTEEMIAQLARMHPERLGVIARTSAMRYKNADKSVEQIGRELGVHYLLEGSARREGDRVRITTQLIRASDQTQLWADSYDRELTGILTLQNDVARGIAKSLALRLLPDVEARLAQARPVVPEAYEAYLKGREHLHKLGGPDLEAALRYFELALRKDPQYALAHAGISSVWGARQQMGYVPPREATPRSKAAAAQALALDSTLPEAHFRLAVISTWSEWDWARGEREFRRAIDLDPNYAEARALYSHLLLIVKRPAEAMTQIERALELDPFRDVFRALYGVDLNILGRYDDAITQFTSALQTAPANPVALSGLQAAYHHKQMYDEALGAEQALWRARGDSEMAAALQQGHAEAGYQGAMRRAAQTLAARSRAANTAPLRVANLYMRAGDSDQALAWLEKSYEARDPNMPYIGVKGIYDQLREHPRFQDLLRRMRLPA
jgi:serine/threonine-protein kinase